MIYRFAPSFDRSFRRLPPDRQKRVQGSVDRLIDLLNIDPLPGGIGLKKLRGNFWELRSGLSDRLMLTLEKDTVTFVLAGNHDEVQRHLKQR